MVKSKQKQIRYPPGKHQRNKASREDDDAPDESDWMMVKKQIITILIPPLPNKVRSTMPSLVGESHPQGNPKITISQSPDKSNSSLKSPSDIRETEKSISLSPKEVIHCPEINPTVPKEPSLFHRIGSDKGSKRRMMFDDSSAFINRMMRASYLERKLKKAGGLENWLVSLGLTRFVKVFRRRNVNKFQLANLTMKKLKDMGADAVGPRRMLMHAIDCLCQPHCFHRV